MSDESAPTPFVVKSVRGSHCLELSGPVQHGSDEYDVSTFTAALRGDRVNASVSVVDYNLSGWSELFSSLAREWRGFDGVKQNASAYGHLDLACTADFRGHVSIRATLRGDFENSDWLAEETIVVEAGQLEDLAQKAGSFFARPAS
jgi:hypothetical protein